MDMRYWKHLTKFKKISNQKLARGQPETLKRFINLQFVTLLKELKNS